MLGSLMLATVYFVYIYAYATGGFHGGHVGGQNKEISIVWKMNYIFMQNAFIVSDH